MTLDLSQLEPLLIPAPPPGVQRNTVNPPSRSSQIYIVAGVCLTLITVFSSVRMHALQKRLVAANRWWLEASIWSAILLAVAFIVICVVQASYPAFIGVHGWDVSLKTCARKTPVVLTLTIQVCYAAALFCVKFSLLLIYMTLFQPGDKLRWTCMVAVVVTFLWHLVCALAVPSLCSPRHGSTWLDYLLALDDTPCELATRIAIGQGVFNIVSGIVLLVLPLQALLTMKLPYGKNFRVGVLVSACLCAVLASSLATYFRVYSDQHRIDHSWTVVSIFLASFGELTVGVLVLCMPAVAAVWRTQPGRHASSRTYPSSYITMQGQSVSPHDRSAQPSVVTDFDADSIKYFKITVGKLDGEKPGSSSSPA